MMKLVSFSNYFDNLSFRPITRITLDISTESLQDYKSMHDVEELKDILGEELFEIVKQISKMGTGV